jgi:alanine-glyoxylate transaminase/serine-glyoxylate transaminase/serine-pyruvate transaminase
VTRVLVQGREPSVISDYCREKCGVVLGRGIGELQGRAFRIAHMGHVNAPMVFGVLGAIEMGLEALSIPRGRSGLQAAVEYLGREVRP